MHAPRPFKIPESVLVVIHTPALDVLLIRRVGGEGHWQSVTGSKDMPDEPFEATARRARRFTRDGLPPTPAPITAPPLDRDRAVTLDLCATKLDRPLDHAGDWAGPYGEAPR